MTIDSTARRIARTAQSTSNTNCSEIQQLRADFAAALSRIQELEKKVQSLETEVNPPPIDKSIIPKTSQ